MQFTEMLRRQSPRSTVLDLTPEFEKLWQRGLEEPPTRPQELMSSLIQIRNVSPQLMEEFRGHCQRVFDMKKDKEQTERNNHNRPEKVLEIKGNKKKQNVVYYHSTALLGEAPLVSKVSRPCNRTVTGMAFQKFLTEHFLTSKDAAKSWYQREKSAFASNFDAYFFAVGSISVSFPGTAAFFSDPLYVFWVFADSLRLPLLDQSVCLPTEPFDRPAQ